MKKMAIFPNRLAETSNNNFSHVSFTGKKVPLEKFHTDSYLEHVKNTCLSHLSQDLTQLSKDVVR